MAAGASTARGNGKEMAAGRAASLGKPRAAGPERQSGTLKTLPGSWHLETLKLDDCKYEGQLLSLQSDSDKRPWFRAAVEPGKILYSPNRMRYAHCASSQQRVG